MASQVACTVGDDSFLSTPTTNAKVTPVTPIELVTSDAERRKMRELEELSIDKRDDSNKDPKNAALLEEARITGRNFYTKLFVVTKREGNNIKWKGWTGGHFKEIKFTEHGKEYAKTSKFEHPMYPFDH